MSTVTRCTVVLFLCVLLALPSFAQNVSITDYQVPVSSAKRLRLNANYDWAGQADAPPQANTFSAALAYRTFYSSLPFAWFLDAAGRTSKSGVAGSNTEWQYTTQASGEIRKYFSDTQDWFGSGGLSFEYAKSDSQPEVTGRVAGGYGRYINATALARAVRIEDLLIKENVIKDHMSKESMIKIANIIEREDEYRELYGTTYEVQWFADIEKEIDASGTLVGDDLGALGLFRIREVLFPGQVGAPPVNQRYYGWDVSAGVEFELLNRFDQDLRTPQLSLVGDYAIPIDWSMQLDAKAKINTPLDSNFFKAVSVTGTLEYLYEMSNRINFLAGYNLQYVKPGSNLPDQTNHGLDASFLFYIENNINYVVTGSLIKTGTADPFYRVSMALQYNLFY